VSFILHGRCIRRLLDIIKEGSYVRVKQSSGSRQINMTPLLLNRIGTVTCIHPNGIDCTVIFEEMPLWHGTLRDLELIGPVLGLYIQL